MKKERTKSEVFASRILELFETEDLTLIEAMATVKLLYKQFEAVAELQRVQFANTYSGIHITDVMPDLNRNLDELGKEIENLRFAPLGTLVPESYVKS